MPRKPADFTIKADEIGKIGEKVRKVQRKRSGRNPPLVLDEDGNTKPTYEQHPTSYPAKGIDEAGTLIRTRFPIFSCEYADSVARPIPKHIPQVYDLKTGMHFFDLRLENEADLPTDIHKQYALLHAASWLILESSGKLPRPADEMEALRKYDRIITGQEALPPKPRKPSRDDPDSPF